VSKLEALSAIENDKSWLAERTEQGSLINQLINQFVPRVGTISLEKSPCEDLQDKFDDDVFCE
jgi:hypothetical protein